MAATVQVTLPSLTIGFNRGDKAIRALGLVGTEIICSSISF
jgi:hypothetical protein